MSHRSTLNLAAPHSWQGLSSLKLDRGERHCFLWFTLAQENSPHQNVVPAGEFDSLIK